MKNTTIPFVCAVGHIVLFLPSPLTDTVLLILIINVFAK